MTYEQFATWREQPEDLCPLLTVVIPAYNESARIVPTIASIATYLAESDYTFEIIVSDDGSTDGTPDLCRSLGLRNLVVLEPAVNRGKGAAIRDGVQAANGDLVLFTDADLSTPIEEIDVLLDRIFDADVAIGSRAAHGADEGAKPLRRRILSAACRRIVRGGLGLDVLDSQCGFKLFRRDAARRLFGLGRIDGFSFDAEILFLASREGLRVSEVPVRWVDAPGSTVSSFRVSMRFVVDIVRIRLAAATGRYRPGARPDLNSGLRIGVVTALPPSTASLTEYGQHLVTSLAEVADVDEVVVYAEDTNGTPPSTPGVTIVPSWRFDALSSPFNVVRHVRRSRPDAVLFNMHFTSFGSRRVAAALGLMIPLALRLMGIPTVVLVHNLVETTDLDAAGYSSGRLEQRVLRRIGKALTRVLLHANHVVTTMPAYVEVLRTHYGASNVSLTPHGAFEALPLPQPKGRIVPRLLAFGKFGTYKRVDDLIAAYRILCERRGPGVAELVIAGTDSPSTPGYLAATEYGCSDLSGVSFWGYVAEEDVDDMFLSSDIVVFPYTGTTGSSGPLHQAGSYGRAVVAPRLGDFIELISEEGYEAEPFSPGDTNSLADAIESLIDDKARRESMGAQNHAAAVGLPLADIAEWHVAHLRNAITAR